ncbi:NAD(P)/FAD-dependent oxidoreductase [Lacibacterium aquatile]|uniref:NAD(P)/FAD-dependent oxidoreductase n=1 Tax=Lacibacterium aquatile TaxID=1168082 RepID=A0ABW5DN22_9PROT
MKDYTRPLSRRVAVIGSGAAGLAAAWSMRDQHEVTLFEKADYLGGHANTVEVAAADGTSIAVDTGFIVYNDLNYPNLVKLFAELGVATQPTEMSFGVSIGNGKFEYAGGKLTGLFGQPVNLFRPRFWSMVADILRFYREAPSLLVSTDNISLGDYLKEKAYGRAFVQDHLLPMAAAIWSAPAKTMLSFPAKSFIRFCVNHGLLQLKGRPQWRTVIGGSREYVKRIAGGINGRVHLNAGVRSLRRRDDRVILETGKGDTHEFDDVVLACHANEALTLLADATPEEKNFLSAFKYQPNLAVLHSDPHLMPRREKIWSAWNYLGTGGGQDEQQLCVTYWMNRLQSLSDKLPLFVTLNPIIQPNPALVHRTFTYDHPIFDTSAMAAQRQLQHLQGVRRTWFCGSYTGYGFHEDAVTSGLAVATQLRGRTSTSAIAPEAV